MAVESQGCGPAPYRRRHPETTALYQVVQQHLETYLALAGEDDWDGQRVPAYVELEFRRYLECGILAYGFGRAGCADCGHDFMVAVSCKWRGLCPSCNARRMAETAGTWSITSSHHCRCANGRSRCPSDCAGTWSASRGPSALCCTSF
jgi:hypothetical protein